MSTICKRQKLEHASSSSPDLIEEFSETSLAMEVNSTVLSSSNNNTNANDDLSSDKLIAEAIKNMQSVEGVSGQMSRSVPSQLNRVTVNDGPEATRGVIFVKKHFRPSNLKLVLKAPWKSLKNLSLDKLARWKNQYDLSEAPVNNSSNRRLESLFGPPQTDNKPLRRLGFGRLTHWKNHYDLSEALEDFEASHFSGATYKFMEIRSMPDHRVVDSSSEYLVTPEKELNEERGSTSTTTTSTTSSKTPSETEL